VTLQYERRDIISGMIIYAAGDTVAALLLNEFVVWRLLGVMALGGTVYAFEIPNYFNWIDRRTTADPSDMSRALRRTGLALLYFNPLWIARHLFFLHLFSGQWEAVGWSLLKTGALSWLFNIPLSALGNYIIQVKLPLRQRFLGSAIFSGLMAIYYALWK